MKKEKCILIILIMLFFTENWFLIYKKNNHPKTIFQTPTVYKIYVETGENTNSYVKYSNNTFPTNGYVLNAAASSCTNGGLVYQDSNKKIQFTGTSADKCNLYFDVDGNLHAGPLKMAFADGNNSFTSSLSAGESTEKTFTIQNTGNTPAAAKMYFLNLKNTFNAATMLYSLSYSETQNGNYKYINIDNVPVSYNQTTSELANGIIIPANTTYYYKFKLKRVVLNATNQQWDSYATMSTSFKIEAIDLPDNTGKADQTLQKLQSLNNTIKVTRVAPDFNYTSEGKGSDGNINNSKISNGLYAAEDDYGTSYYFRGNVSNYVDFAGFKWKIIRINGDGTLRITISAYEEELSSSKWNNTYYNDNAYVGFMHGYEQTNNTYEVYETKSYEEAHMNKYNSTMKDVLDNWYTTNLSSQSSKIADSIFCGDRSKDTSSSGYGKNQTYYSVKWRRFQVGIATLKCPQKNDAFTVNDTILGNGRLTNPIGLITLDEIAMAGHIMSVANETAYTRSNMAQMSPNSYNGSSAVVDALDNAQVKAKRVSDSDVKVTPVINLTQEAVMAITDGNGSSNFPFMA